MSTLTKEDMIKAIIRDVLAAINRVENSKNKMFSEIDAQLEDEIFAAIDSKCKFKLFSVLKRIEEIK